MLFEEFERPLLVDSVKSVADLNLYDCFGVSDKRDWDKGLVLLTDATMLAPVS